MKKFKISRLGQKGFGISMVVSLILILLLVLLDIPNVLITIFIFINFVWMVILYIGRLHDIGYSGWWTILVMLTSILGIIILASYASTKKVNKYGEVPPKSALDLLYFWRREKNAEIFKLEEETKVDVLEKRKNEHFLRKNWFKIGILIFLFLLIILFSFKLNSKNLDESNFEKVNNNSTQLNPLTQNPHNIYNNESYGYKIAYPRSWSISGNSVNSDGAILYTGDSSSDIRIFASIHPDDDSLNPEIIKETILLDNGDTANIVQRIQNGKNILKIFILKNETYYEFSASVSGKFYSENSELLLQIARSLNVYGY